MNEDIFDILSEPKGIEVKQGSNPFDVFSVLTPVSSESVVTISTTKDNAEFQSQRKLHIVID